VVTCADCEAPAVEGRKRCAVHLAEKVEHMRAWSAKHPDRRKAQARRHYLAHREEYLARARAQREADPARKKAQDRARYKSKSEEWRATGLRRYGLTIEEYDALLAAQGGCCAICGRTEAGGRHRRLHVDHDHGFAHGDKAGVRGLLCTSCNMGLGRFKDDAVNLRRAADYLDRHAASRLRIVRSG
jgi:hypothetical protein